MYYIVDIVATSLAISLRYHCLFVETPLRRHTLTPFVSRRRLAITLILPLRFYDIFISLLRYITMIRCRHTHYC